MRLLLGMGMLIVAALSAAPASAQPPYCEGYCATSYESRERRTRELVTAYSCANDQVCLGALLVDGDKVYKITKLGKDRYTVTSRKAREMIGTKRAYVVFEGSRDWKDIATKYLVAATGQ